VVTVIVMVTWVRDLIDSGVSLSKKSHWFRVVLNQGVFLSQDLVSQGFLQVTGGCEGSVPFDYNNTLQCFHHFLPSTVDRTPIPTPIQSSVHCDKFCLERMCPSLLLQTHTMHAFSQWTRADGVYPFPLLQMFVLTNLKSRVSNLSALKERSA
jgi:hypothetical protein